MCVCLLCFLSPLFLPLLPLPHRYPTGKMEMKIPDEVKNAKGVAKMKAWEAAYWTWSQAVMKKLDGKDNNGGCTDDQWETDGCQSRGGFMHIEMGMPAHDKSVRDFETMTYGRSRTNPPAFWKAAPQMADGNVLKDLCTTFDNGDGTVVVAIVVGHTPSGIVPDYLASTSGKCLTYNGDTSMQGGPGGGEAKHHGCDEAAGAACAGESHLLIKATGDSFTFEIEGHVKAGNGNFGKHLTGESKNDALEHKASINTAELAKSDGTAAVRRSACVLADKRKVTKFGELGTRHPIVFGDKPIPEASRNTEELSMHKRAALTLPEGGALCASARAFGFDYDVVKKGEGVKGMVDLGEAGNIGTAASKKVAAEMGTGVAPADPNKAAAAKLGTADTKNVAKGTRFRSFLRASASVAAAAPSSSINDEWAALYGGSAGVEGFPGDGITS